MINFKRIAGVLALTMALIQVMPAVPVEAEEEVEVEELAEEEEEVEAEEEVEEEVKEEKCYHIGCVNYAEEAVYVMCNDCQEEVVRYDSNNDGWNHRYFWKCKCGLEDSYLEYCDFVDGECSKCKQSQPTVCSHENCGSDSLSNMGICAECSNPGMWSDECVKVNDTTHKYVLICGKCSSEIMKYEGYTHYNYENGYCECGYYVGTGNTSSENKEEPEYKAPTEEEKEEQRAEEIEEQRAEAISKAVEEKIAEEEAIPVTSFVSAEAVNAIPAEVKDTTTEAVFNVSKITTTRGFVAAVDKIVKANPEAKSVSFYSDKPFSFNTNSLAALTNANTEFVYMFKHEGHLYKVTIPEGAKVDLAGQKFAGPLYIGAQLGTSVLVK